MFISLNEQRNSVLKNFIINDESRLIIEFYKKFSNPVCNIELELYFLNSKLETTLFFYKTEIDDFYLNIYSKLFLESNLFIIWSFLLSS